jgi:hypothetical protein
MKNDLQPSDRAEPVPWMPSEWPAPGQFAFALGIVALSLLIRWLREDILGPRMPFVLTLGVLLPLVLLVRPGPFVAAVVVGWFGALYLFVPPVRGFAITEPEEAMMVGLCTGLLGLTAIAAWLSRRVVDAIAKRRSWRWRKRGRT